MYTEFQKLQSAVRLPSAEQALAAFKDIADLNTRYEDKYDNILHYMISAFESEHLRISDFEALIELGVDVNARPCGDPSAVMCGFRRYLRIARTNGPMSDTSQRGSSNNAASSATW